MLGHADGWFCAGHIRERFPNPPSILKTAKRLCSTHVTLTMLCCWEYGTPGATGDRGTPCLELLNTSDWFREAGWPASWGATSASQDADGGVLPSNTARSILQNAERGFRISQRNTGQPRGLF